MFYKLLQYWKAHGSYLSLLHIYYSSSQKRSLKSLLKTCQSIANKQWIPRCIDFTPKTSITMIWSVYHC